jgi:hypothetical protein
MFLFVFFFSFFGPSLGASTLTLSHFNVNVKLDRIKIVLRSLTKIISQKKKKEFNKILLCVQYCDFVNKKCNFRSNRKK